MLPDMGRLLLLGFRQQMLEQPLSAILQCLYEGLPQAEITLLAIYSTDDVASSLGLPDDWPSEVANQPGNQFWAVTSPSNYESLAESIQRHNFDAAIILSAPAQSPYALAYLCYLAGVPIRIGVSQEFGGGVLSTCIKPPFDVRSWLANTLNPVAEIGG